MNLLKKTVEKYIVEFAFSLKDREITAHKLLMNRKLDKYSNAYEEIFLPYLLDLSGGLITACFVKYPLEEIIEAFYKAVIEIDPKTFDYPMNSDLVYWDCFIKNLKESKNG